MNIYLSVIVLTYNAAPFIERCLKSLLEQTLDGIEYIIINDASTDNTLDIITQTIDQYPSKKSNISLINHSKNKGLAYSRSEGLHLAKGYYIIYCDSDDWVDKDYYASLYQLATNGKADMAIGPYIVEETNKSIKCQLPLFNDWDELQNHPKWEFLPIWCHLIRRQFLIDNDIDFYTDVDYAEDYGLLIRCYFHSKKNLSLQQPIYYHYSKFNTDSMTCNKYKIINLINKERCMLHLADFLNNHGYNAYQNAIILDEMRGVKEGYLLTSPPDFKRWREGFPAITKIILKDNRYSLPYKVILWLGQKVDPFFIKCYMALNKLKYQNKSNGK